MLKTQFASKSHSAVVGRNEKNDTSTEILVAIFLLKALLLIAPLSFFTLWYYLSINLKYLKIILSNHF